MSSSDLPELWTEPTKIGHIFRKQSTYFKNQSSQKISFVKVDLLLVQYSSQKKKFRKIPLIFDAEKWLWKYEFCNLWGECS